MRLHIQVRQQVPSLRSSAPSRQPQNHQFRVSSSCQNLILRRASHYQKEIKNTKNNTNNNVETCKYSPRQRNRILAPSCIIAQNRLTIHNHNNKIHIWKNHHGFHLRHHYSTLNTNNSNQSRICVLGIETSCDDTAAAVVTDKREILGESLSNQAFMHFSLYGGVYPHIAKRSHEQCIDYIIESAMKQSGLQFSELSAVAVTVGPGLSPCLWTGLNKAKQISAKYNIPFLAINHLEAHGLVVRLENEAIQFPYFLLLISGGHCQTLLCSDIGKYKMIGGTIDDSIGEAFDKMARLLNIQSPQSNSNNDQINENTKSQSTHPGELLENLAKQGNAKGFGFPVPMRGKGQNQLPHFSFSGLKSSVARMVQKLEQQGPVAPHQSDLAASFQHIAFTHLIDKTRKAITIAKETDPNLKTFVVAGGVARNALLRSELETLAAGAELNLVIPSTKLCADNGVMIAWAGVERFLRGKRDNAEATDARPNWPLEECESPQNTSVSGDTSTRPSASSTRSPK